MSGISAKLPLDYDSTDGAYALNKTNLDTIRQNFKMLMLTNPGERVADPRFGIGIKRRLFEQQVSQAYDSIRVSILEQTRIYLPFIEILNIFFVSKEQNPNLDDYEINVKVEYGVPSLSRSDILNINVSVN